MKSLRNGLFRKLLGSFLKIFWDFFEVMQKNV